MRAHDRAAAAPDPFERAERHQQCVGAGKAHHLARNIGPLPGLDRDARADRHGVDRPGDLHHQAAHPDHAAVDLDRVELLDLLGQRLHENRLRSTLTRGPSLTACLPASLIIASPSVGPVGRSLPGLDGRRAESYESATADS